MFLQAIDTAAVTDVGDCPVRRDLAALAAGLDTRFLKAGTTLSMAIDLVDQVIGGLDGIVASLGERTAGVAVADMRDVATHLNALPERQLDRDARMEAVDATAGALNAHVLDMHQALRVLGIYGTNIKIAASGEEHFVGFVDGMNARLAAGERHLVSFVAQLKVLKDAVNSVRQGDRLLAAEIAKVLPAAPARLDLDAQALAGHLAEVAGLARRVATVARSVQGKVAVVLGALQVGDSTRQRLEHVVSALQMLTIHPGAADDPAVVAHIERLLAAQLDGTLADFTRETTAMLVSLAELGTDAAVLLDLIVEQDGDGGRTFLERIDRGIADVDRVTARLRDAEARGQAMVGTIAATVGDLTDRLADVQLVQLHMQDISTNTRLLCRRHGIVGKAVSVIAIEVNDYARRLGVSAVGVNEAIDRLGRAEASLREVGANGRDMGDTLSAALSVIREACRCTEEVIGTGSDDARQLIALLAVVTREMEGEFAVGNRIGDMARLLARRAPAAEITADAAATLSTLLPQIAKLYTMASEREIHMPFLLPGMDVESPPVAADDVDDDDGLF